MEKKILIIDDNDVERFLLRRGLIKLGVDDKLILDAHGGEEGFKAISEHKPEVVLLDVNMPKMNGLEVLEMIKNTYDTPPPYVVMLTTSQHESDLEASITSGADAFSVKPNEPSKMKEILRAIKIMFIHREDLDVDLKSVFQYIKEH